MKYFNLRPDKSSRPRVAKIYPDIRELFRRVRGDELIPSRYTHGHYPQANRTSGHLDYRTPDRPYRNRSSSGTAPHASQYTGSGKTMSEMAFDNRQRCMDILQTQDLEIDIQESEPENRFSETELLSKDMEMEQSEILPLDEPEIQIEHMDNEIEVFDDLELLEIEGNRALLEIENEPIGDLESTLEDNEMLLNDDEKTLENILMDDFEKKEEDVSPWQKFMRQNDIELQSLSGE